MLPTLEIDETQRVPGDSDMRGRPEEVAGFKWRKASPVPSGRVLAFLCGVAMTAAAGVYGRDNLKIFSGPQTSQTALAAEPARAEKPAQAVASAPKSSTVGSALAAPAAVVVAGSDKDTTAVFADPKPDGKADDKTDKATDNTTDNTKETAAPAAPASTPAAAPPKPTVLNRAAAPLAPKQEARPVDKPANKQPARSVENKTLPSPSTYPSSRPYNPNEAVRPAPRLRPEPARGPRVDPDGRGSGYWNGSDFN